MSAIARIEIRNREAKLQDHRVAVDSRNHLKLPVIASEELGIYWIQAKDMEEIPKEELSNWCNSVFCDKVIQDSILTADDLKFTKGGTSLEPAYGIEVRFRPGVTDNVGRSATEALKIFSKFAREHDLRVFSGKLILVYGDVTRAQVEKIGVELIGNTLIEELTVLSYHDLCSPERFLVESVPDVVLGEAPAPIEIDLHVEDKILEKLSRDNCWALTIEELRKVRDHFDNPRVIGARTGEGLPKNPTDVEIEVIAQTWSEHCKHKIFASHIEYSESTESKEDAEYYPKLNKFEVKSLYKTYIQGATKSVRERRRLDWLISVFSDNAGIVRFDDNIDLCIKVETHNSPSALDPYGGALTGIVGVNRDILGCGMGARPIANTDVFCFAPPNWPGPREEKELPHGLKHPRRILEGVHQGIEDGGNKSGIPTVNGAFSFDKSFAGKPLVFCGTIGVLPQMLPSGINSSQKGQKPGDHVVMAGGKVGKDGIHGATFSSMELNETAPATAVQIADPITQKRLADFLFEARDKELFTSVTDNGAGGLSSSVGEMAERTNGATMDVAKVPLKYPGLSPFEITISESQERMTFSVSEEKLEEFSELAARRGVEVTSLGSFTNDGFFRIQYDGRTVGLLSLEFLHNGAPDMRLTADWKGPGGVRTWLKVKPKALVDIKEMNTRAFYELALFRILAAWNVRSKEDLVRRYDHEVQAATVVKPFVGRTNHGPGDAGAIWLGPHGGSEDSGIAIGCGIVPRYSHHDTYVMSQHALDEAMRNCVAVGGDPDMVCMTDNFCWPDPLPSAKNPEAEHKLAQLVRACAGLYSLANVYGAPFVSGKDSMKNDFVGKSRFGKDIRISVPPTILITAMAKIPEIDKACTSDLKYAGDKIYLLGKSKRALGGSELIEEFSFAETSYVDKLPLIDAEKNMALYRATHQAIRRNLLQSCHDCSEGGLLIALSESAIGGNLGVRIELDDCRDQLDEFGATLLEFFFNESAGRFLVSVSPRKEEEFLEHFKEVDVTPFGEVTHQKILRICDVGLVLVDAPVSALSETWRGGMSR